MSLVDIDAVAEARLLETSAAPLPNHAMQALSFVYDEQDILNTRVLIRTRLDQLWKIYPSLEEADTKTNSAAHAPLYKCDECDRWFGSPQAPAALQVPSSATISNSLTTSILRVCPISPIMTQPRPRTLQCLCWFADFFRSSTRRI